MPEISVEASARVYKLMRTAAYGSDREELRRQIPEFERMYLEALEQEKENYDQMVRLLTREELRIERPENVHGEGCPYRLSEPCGFLTTTASAL